MLRITPIPAFNDNYLWMIQASSNTAENNFCVVVDPGDAKPIKAYLDKNKLELTAILITHQHPDHIGGVSELLETYPKIPVYGPADISVVTHAVVENNSVDVLGEKFKVIAVPGHTMNHLAYYGDNKLFCGDTLFSAGCGRMFEGTPEVFLASLNKLKQLPSETKIYCAHEYTQFNLLFAESIEPDNKNIMNYQENVKLLRAENKPSLPSNIGLELRVNPFLRTDISSVKNTAKKLLNINAQSEVSEIEIFAALREAKNSFSA